MAAKESLGDSILVEPPRKSEQPEMSLELRDELLRGAQDTSASEGLPQTPAPQTAV